MVDVTADAVSFDEPAEDVPLGSPEALLPAALMKALDAMKPGMASHYQNAAASIDFAAFVSEQAKSNSALAHLPMQAIVEGNRKAFEADIKAMLADPDKAEIRAGLHLIGGAGARNGEREKLEADYAATRKGDLPASAFSRELFDGIRAAGLFMPSDEPNADGLSAALQTSLPRAQKAGDRGAPE